MTIFGGLSRTLQREMPPKRRKSESLSLKKKSLTEKKKLCQTNVLYDKDNEKCSKISGKHVPKSNGELQLQHISTSSNKRSSSRLSHTKSLEGCTNPSANKIVSEKNSDKLISTSQDGRTLTSNLKTSLNTNENLGNNLDKTSDDIDNCLIVSNIKKKGDRKPSTHIKNCQAGNPSSPSLRASLNENENLGNDLIDTFNVSVSNMKRGRSFSNSTKNSQVKNSSTPRLRTSLNANKKLRNNLVGTSKVSDLKGKRNRTSGNYMKNSQDENLLPPSLKKALNANENLGNDLVDTVIVIDSKSKSGRLSSNSIKISQNENLSSKRLGTFMNANKNLENDLVSSSNISDLKRKRNQISGNTLKNSQDENSPSPSLKRALNVNENLGNNLVGTSNVRDLKRKRNQASGNNRKNSLDESLSSSSLKTSLNASENLGNNLIDNSNVSNLKRKRGRPFGSGIKDKAKSIICNPKNTSLLPKKTRNSEKLKIDNENKNESKIINEELFVSDQEVSDSLLKISESICSSKKLQKCVNVEHSSKVSTEIVSESLELQIELKNRKYDSKEISNIKNNRDENSSSPSLKVSLNAKENLGNNLFGTSNVSNLKRKRGRPFGSGIKDKAKSIMCNSKNISLLPRITRNSEKLKFDEENKNEELFVADQEVSDSSLKINESMCSSNKLQNCVNVEHSSKILTDIVSESLELQIELKNKKFVGEENLSKNNNNIVVKSEPVDEIPSVSENILREGNYSIVKLEPIDEIHLISTAFKSITEDIKPEDKPSECNIEPMQEIPFASEVIKACKEDSQSKISCSGVKVEPLEEISSHSKENKLDKEDNLLKNNCTGDRQESVKDINVSSKLNNELSDEVKSIQSEAFNKITGFDKTNTSSTSEPVYIKFSNKKFSSKFIKRKKLSGSESKMSIPGIYYMLIIVNKTKNKYIFLYDCVLCNALKRNFGREELRSHMRTREHLLNVLEVDNYEMFEKIKDDKSVSDETLFKEVCKCEPVLNTRSIATSDNYDAKRKVLAAKILKLREARKEKLISISVSSSLDIHNTTSISFSTSVDKIDKDSILLSSSPDKMKMAPILPSISVKEIKGDSALLPISVDKTKEVSPSLSTSVAKLKKDSSFCSLGNKIKLISTVIDISKSKKDLKIHETKNRLKSLAERQKQRRPSRIVLLIDDRFANLKTEVLGDYFKVINMGNCNFENAVDILQTKHIIGNDSLIIIMFGIYSLIDCSMSHACTRKDFSKMLTMCSRSISMTASILISKALTVHEYILDNTDNDQVMLCELIPINIVRQTTKMGNNNHTFTYPALKENYSRCLEVIENYNSFVKTHCDIFGFKKWDLLKNSFPVKHNVLNTLSRSYDYNAIDFKRTSDYVMKNVMKLLGIMKQQCPIEGSNMFKSIPSKSTNQAGLITANDCASPLTSTTALEVSKARTTSAIATNIVDDVYNHLVFIGCCWEQLQLVPREIGNLKNISLIHVKPTFDFQEVKNKLNSIEILNSCKKILFVVIGSIMLLSNECSLPQCLKFKCQKPVTYLTMDLKTEPDFACEKMKNVLNLVSQIKQLYSNRSLVLIIPLPTRCVQLPTDNHKNLHESLDIACNSHLILDNMLKWIEADDELKILWKKEMFLLFNKAEKFKRLISQLTSMFQNISFVHWIISNKESPKAFESIEQCKKFLRNLITTANPSIKLKISQLCYHDSNYNLSTKQIILNKSVSLMENKYSKSPASSKNGLKFCLDINKVKILKNNRFKHVYVVGKKELSQLLDMNYLKNVDFIQCNKYHYLLKNKIPEFLKQFGNIKPDSICILALDLLCFANEINVSPWCRKFKCEKTSSIMNLDIGDDSETNINLYILNNLDLRSFIESLSQYLPVIAMPFFPARLFCESASSYTRHVLGHMINRNDSYIVDGKKETWQSYCLSAVQMWSNIMRWNNEKFFEAEELKQYITENYTCLTFEDNVDKYSLACAEINTWKSILEAYLKILGINISKKKKLPLNSRLGTHIDYSKYPFDNIPQATLQDELPARTNLNSSKSQLNDQNKTIPIESDLNTKYILQNEIYHSNSSRKKSRLQSPIVSSFKSRSQSPVCSSSSGSRSQSLTTGSTSSSSSQSHTNSSSSSSISQSLTNSSSSRSRSRSPNINLHSKSRYVSPTKTRSRSGRRIRSRSRERVSHSYSRKKRSRSMSRKRESNFYSRKNRCRSRSLERKSHSYSREKKCRSRSRSRARESIPRRRNSHSKSMRIDSSSKSRKDESTRIHKSISSRSLKTTCSLPSNINEPTTSQYSKEFSDEFSVEEAVVLLEKINFELGMLGPAMMKITRCARDYGINSEKTRQLFTDERNIILLNMVVEKLNVLSKFASSSDLTLLTKTKDWLLKLMDYVINPTESVSLDLDAIANATMYKSPSHIVNIIKAYYAYEGKTNPTNDEVNGAYIKICELHFNMALTKNS